MNKAERITELHSFMTFANLLVEGLRERGVSVIEVDTAGSLAQLDDQLLEVLTQLESPNLTPD